MVGSHVVKLLASPADLWGPSFLFELSGFFPIVCHLIPTWLYPLLIVPSPIPSPLALAVGSNKDGPI